MTRDPVKVVHLTPLADSREALANRADGAGANPKHDRALGFVLLPCQQPLNGEPFVVERLPTVIRAVDHSGFTAVRTIVTCSIVVTLSTLKRRMSPAATDVVHPVSVVSEEFVAVEIVTGAAAVMLSASVGG